MELYRSWKVLFRDNAGHSRPIPGHLRSGLGFRGKSFWFDPKPQALPAAPNYSLLEPRALDLLLEAVGLCTLPPNPKPIDKHLGS